MNEPDELAGLTEDVREALERIELIVGVSGDDLPVIRAELLRLAHENAICREAIEDAVAFVKSVDSRNDDDGESASRRCVERRLSEAIGKACPRLMYERPEGQKFYGLHYRELTERAERAEAELAALKRRIAEAPICNAEWTLAFGLTFMDGPHELDGQRVALLVLP